MTMRALTGWHADDPHAVREAFTLPLLFLTVALAGGFRDGAGGADFRFLPPSLTALVLAMFLLALVVRVGLLAPELLMHSRRTPLENLGGAFVLASFFAASAQVFNCLTPERGLLNFLFNSFFLVLIWNTAAARPRAERLLRSLLVVFLAAFLLKFVVLAALYAPDGGFARRVLTVLLEGVSLGTLEYDLHAPLTGYVAFFTVALFMVGLFLLPRRRRPGAIDLEVAHAAALEVREAAHAPDTGGTPVPAANRRPASPGP